MDGGIQHERIRFSRRLDIISRWHTARLFSTPIDHSQALYTVVLATGHVTIDQTQLMQFHFLPVCTCMAAEFVEHFWSLRAKYRMLTSGTFGHKTILTAHFHMLPRQLCL